MRKCLLTAGELIVVRSGVNTGDCAVVPKHLEDSYAAYDLIIRLIDEVLPEFAVLFLDTRLGRTQLNIRKGRAAQPHLNAEEISSILVPLPPLSIQRKLVAEMEAARESRRHKLAQADALLSGLDAFLLDQLGLTVPEEPQRTSFALPRRAINGERLDAHFYSPVFIKLMNALMSKAHKTLGNFVYFSSEQVDPKSLGERTFRYIEISGVDRVTGDVTASELPTSDAPSWARMKVQRGDIIVSLTRPHHGSIALLGEEFDGCVVSTGFAVIRKIKESDISPLFLFAMLRSRVCLQQMLQRSSGGNYPAITELELQRIVIPLASENIQREIVDELSRRRTEARRLREEAGREWDAAKAGFESKLLGDKKT